MLRQPSIRPFPGVPTSTSNGLAVYYQSDRRKASVPITLTPSERRSSVSSSGDNDPNWTGYQNRVLSTNRYGRRRLCGLSEECLIAETDSIVGNTPKQSFNYRSVDDDRFTPAMMMRDMASTGNELSVPNGSSSRRSIGNHSRKSIIVGPPSCDDVLDELAMMETSLRNRRRKTFFQQIRIFCQRSTLHGLSDLCRAENWWLRFFWLTTFLGALAAAVYGCYHILEQYMESPVVVSYFVQESDLKFPLPDLVICPFNRFNSEFLKNYSVRHDVAQHMQLAFGVSAKHPAQRRELLRYMTPTSMTELDLAMNLTLQRLNLTFDEFLDAASLKCTDFFVDCAFPTGTVPCCNNITGVMTFAGKCYRIRGVDQSGPGYGYGMTIVVSLPKQLYSLAVNNWLNDGILVKLAEPGQGIDYDMTFIPVGTHALMPLKATKYEFMHDPPRFECLTEGEASVNYSRVDCFDACFLEAAQNHCGCAMVGNFNRHKLPLCTTNQYYSCIFSYLKKQFLASHDAEHYFFGCRQRCKPRCTYWQYQSAVSYSKFPSEEARAFAQSDDEWIRMKNTIIVDLYYEKLEFTRIKHYRAMTIHGFIANLGGQYSLWLGGSILTLMQMLVFFFNYTLGPCRRFMTRRHRSENGGRGRDFFGYQSQPMRSSSSVFWRSRSASAGAGARRQSTLSDDLHPQLQALTQNHHHQVEQQRRTPQQSNGNCCNENADSSVYGFVPAQYSSWTDIGGRSQKPSAKDESLNGGCRRRSPSVEAEHFPNSDYHRGQWEPTLLDDFRQRQWASET